uniref:Putative cyclooxygenase-3 n=1 Tax=Rattus norvegicus TaxID=10116 RepID=Q6QWE0_RAT|nr:putative cyclooxygenase-3 [Rattus norvegicus]AAS90838.1 putative cyclooxygenase-3 [Rattus norvegicus]
MSRESDPSGAPTRPGIRWPAGGALNVRLNSLFPLQEGVSRSSFPCCCSCCCSHHPRYCSQMLGYPHQSIPVVTIHARTRVSVSASASTTTNVTVLARATRAPTVLSLRSGPGFGVPCGPAPHSPISC